MLDAKATSIRLSDFNVEKEHSVRNAEHLIELIQHCNGNNEDRKI